MCVAECEIVRSGEVVGPISAKYGEFEYREVCVYEVYLADYYGNGRKEYLRRRYYTEFVPTGGRILHNASDDGNPDRIAKFLESVGA